MTKYFQALPRLMKAFAKNPVTFVNSVNGVSSSCDARNFAKSLSNSVKGDSNSELSAENPLWSYFQNHKEGRGIWKWEHYFDVYHRHFARFIGEKVNVLEIGIYSGGSLEMWRSYFGDKCHVFGVDIENACKVYENSDISISIGDQSDRSFWTTFKNGTDGIDILIDDGGHGLEHQQITLEEMLPYIRPGGVYLCEDVHGRFNRFAAFAAGLVSELNDINFFRPGDSSVSEFQSIAHSIHFYPYVVVIEKHRVPPAALRAIRHGTEWQPFLGNHWVVPPELQINR